MSALDLSIGAVEVGVLVSTVLFGISLVQTYAYIDREFKDHFIIRFMVFGICVLETFHTACIWAYLYGLTVTDSGIPSRLPLVPWSLIAPIVGTAVISIAVQCFLAYRIRVLSGQLILPSLAWIVAFFHAILAFVMCAFAVDSKSLPVFLEKHDWIIIADLASHAAVDIYNAIALSYFLLSRRTKFNATKRVVDKLVLYTLETGLITSVCSLAILACAVSMKNNFVYLGIFMIYPKLFAIVFLVSLTARKTLREDAASAMNISQPLVGTYTGRNTQSEYLHGSLPLTSMKTYDTKKISSMQSSNEFDVVA